MERKEIIDDFPEITEEDIKACLEFAADENFSVILQPS